VVGFFLGNIIQGNKDLQGLALSHAVYQDPAHPRSSARRKEGKQKDPQFAGDGGRAFSRQSLLVLEDKWDFIVRTRFPKITSYEKFYEFIAEKPWKFGDRTPLKKKLKKVLFMWRATGLECPLTCILAWNAKQSNSLLKFFRWIFKGPDDSVDYEAFSKTQGMRPRRSVSSKAYLEMENEDLPRPASLTDLPVGDRNSKSSLFRRSDLNSEFENGEEE